MPVGDDDECGSCAADGTAAAAEAMAAARRSSYEAMSSAVRVSVVGGLRSMIVVGFVVCVYVCMYVYKRIEDARVSGIVVVVAVAILTIIIMSLELFVRVLVCVCVCVYACMRVSVNVKSRKKERTLLLPHPSSPVFN